MIKAISQFFNSQIKQQAMTGTTLELDHALQLATAALLIEITRADHHVEESERLAVDYAILEMFSLTDKEAQELVRLAELEVRQSTSLYEFTTLVDKQFDLAQKIQVVEMLWRVVFSDGSKDKYEEYTVRKIADLIHISHRDFIRARHKVENELVNGP